MCLKNDVVWKLRETYVVPSFRRNLISIFVLDKEGYSCLFGNRQRCLYRDSNLLSTSSLSSVDNLYLLNTASSNNVTLHVNTRGTKRKLTDENSYFLWHGL